MKAPGGSRGTPGMTTAQRAMPIQKEPNAPLQRFADGEQFLGVEDRII